MKYSNVITVKSDELHKLEKEPFTDRFYKIHDGEKIGCGYFEIDSKDIPEFEKENPDWIHQCGTLLGSKTYFRGNRAYINKNGKMKLKSMYYVTDKYAFNREKKRFEEIDKFENQHKHLTDDIVTVGKKSLAGFDRLRYCNNIMDYSLPFMMYVPENAKGKLPLVIWNCNAEKHIPFGVYRNFVIKLKRNMKKNPCIILLPAPITHSVITDDNTYDKGYDATFTCFLNKLFAEYPVDKDRIYLFGSSYSAAIAWSQLRLHPDRYAAVVPMMGWYDVVNKEYFESGEYFNKIKNVPIWACHAENDNNIPIGETYMLGVNRMGSDVLVDRLRKAGSTKLKYTRYKKYAHGAAMKFLKKEDWYLWLFEQKRESSEK